MATLTPSGLIKPGYDDPASVFDINNNSELIDLHGLGALVIDTDVFPTDPWEGMKVYKARYQELYVYSTFDGDVTPGQWWLIGAGRKILYTPVIQNITLGTGGVVKGEYIRVGHNGLPNAISIHFRFYLELGTGGDITGNPVFGLPGVPEMWAAGGVDFMKNVGMATASISGATTGTGFPGGILICNSTTAVGTDGETQQLVNITPDTTTLGGLWSPTAPGDWVAGSKLWAQGHYWPDQNGTSWGV